MLLPLLLSAAQMAFSAVCPVQDWDLTVPVDGALADTDCKLSARIPGLDAANISVQYTVDVQTRGIYTFEVSSNDFTATVLVTDGRLNTIGTSGQRVTMQLTPETYHVFVVSGSGAGAFKLQVAFSEQSTCQIRDVAGSQFTLSQNGNLGSGGCRLLDAAAPSGSTRVADIYRFSADQPGLLDAFAQSNVLLPALILVNAKTGATIASDTSGDGLYQSLAPGDYILAVTFAAGTAGAYSIDAVFSPAVNCETRDLRAGDSASGQLTQADCRVLDVLSNSDTDNRMDLYRVQLETDGVLTMEVNSGNFPPAVAIFDSANAVLGSAGSQRANTAARLVMSLKAGTYRIAALHGQLVAGSYTLRTTSEPLRTCTADSLIAGGTLTSADCRVLDLVVPSSDVTPAKLYSLNLAKRTQVTAEMTAGQIDAYLIVLDKSNRTLAEDDNSAGGTNARLSLLLNPGDYTVLANMNGTQGGAYNLSVTQADPRECPADDLVLGDVTAGQLTATDCLIREVITDSARSTLAHFYKLTLKDPATVSLDLTAASFVPAVILVDADGRRIASDEPTSQLTLGGAHVRRALPAGSYGVVVSGTAGQPGEFSLRASLRK